METTTIRITLEDVRRSGGFAEAIEKQCSARSIETGVVHPCQLEDDCDIFAARALAADYAARGYLNWSGRLATLDSEGGVVWTDSSVLCLICPEIGDAVRNPEVVACMARAVRDYHHPRSDSAEWQSLVKKLAGIADLFGPVNSSVWPSR